MAKLILKQLSATFTPVYESMLAPLFVMAALTVASNPVRSAATSSNMYAQYVTVRGPGPRLSGIDSPHRVRASTCKDSRNSLISPLPRRASCFWIFARAERVDALSLNFRNRRSITCAGNSFPSLKISTTSAFVST